MNTFPKWNQEFGFDMTPYLLTAAQLCKLLNVSKRTLWRLRSASKLPAPVRLAGSVRWNANEIAAWINAGCPELSDGDSKKSVVRER